MVSSGAPAWLWGKVRTMMSFGKMLATARPLEDGFALEVGADWLQGRTAYGGLSSALALEAARRALPVDLAAGLPLCSAQFSMIAPLSGPIEARARVVRQGRNAVWITSELWGEKGLGFIATCVFMHRRESVLDMAGYALPAHLIALDEAAPFTTKALPAFMQMHFDVRFALGREHVEAADLCWWVRLRDREGISAEVEAVLVGDALPTAVLPHLPKGTPISSMQWHVNMLSGEARPEDGWWLIRSTSRQSGSGLASEDILQWGANGTPAIAGLQSVAVFG